VEASEGALGECGEFCECLLTTLIHVLHTSIYTGGGCKNTHKTHQTHLKGTAVMSKRKGLSIVYGV